MFDKFGPIFGSFLLAVVIAFIEAWSAFFGTGEYWRRSVDLYRDHPILANTAFQLMTVVWAWEFLNVFGKKADRKNLGTLQLLVRIAIFSILVLTGFIAYSFFFGEGVLAQHALDLYEGNYVAANSCVGAIVMMEMLGMHDFGLGFYEPPPDDK